MLDYFYCCVCVIITYNYYFCIRIFTFLEFVAECPCLFVGIGLFCGDSYFVICLVMYGIKSALVALFLFCGLTMEVRGDILISSVMADPASYDNVYEYVQFLATERVDFSETPFTVVICNNGTIIHPKGWLTGSTLTYAIQLDSGVVEAGEPFYLGGPTPKMNGPNSEEMHVKNWFSFDCTAQEGAGGIGIPQQWRIGMVGNGGPAADGIAVFSGLASDLTEESVPIDCVFYGDAVGDAAAYGYRLPDGSLLNDSSAIFPSPVKEKLFQFHGVYNYVEHRWVVERTSSSFSIQSETDLVPSIRLVPSVFDLALSPSDCETCLSWRSILPDSSLFVVLWHDSVMDCSLLPDSSLCGFASPLSDLVVLTTFDRSFCVDDLRFMDGFFSVLPLCGACLDIVGFDPSYNTVSIPVTLPELPSFYDCPADTLLFLPDGGDWVSFEMPLPLYDDPCGRFSVVSMLPPDSLSKGVYDVRFFLENMVGEFVDSCFSVITVVDSSLELVDTLPVILDDPDTLVVPMDTLPPVMDTLPELVDTLPVILDDPDTLVVPMDTLPPVLDTLPELVDTLPVILDDPDTLVVPTDTLPPVLDTLPELVDTLPAILDDPDTLVVPTDTLPPVLDTLPELVDTLPAILDDPDTLVVPTDTLPPVMDTLPELVDTLPAILDDPDTLFVPTDTLPPVLDTLPELVDTLPVILDDPDTLVVPTDTLPPVLDTLPELVDTLPVILDDPDTLVVPTDTLPPVLDTLPELVVIDSILTDSLWDEGPGLDPFRDSNESSYNCLLTPNGDGYNDEFTIAELSRYPNNELVVLNRWGNVVFEMKEYDNHWRGDDYNRFSLGGTKLLPVGTYYFVFTSNGKKIFSGFIELSY